MLQRVLRVLRLSPPLPPSTSRNHHGKEYHSVELHGGMVDVGEYYAQVYIGGQMLRVQIDTGSATLAVPLHECTNCKTGDMRYDLKKSNSGIAEYISCEHEQCQTGSCNGGYGCGKCSATKDSCCAKSNTANCAFHLNFGDGSGAKGMLVRDEFQWGDVKFPVTFGGIASDSPDFERKQVDGILGMAYKSLACNPSCITPAFDAMLEQEKDEGMPDSFSICITYNSGRLVLGEYDPSLSTKKMTWVDLKLATPPSFYSFPLIGDLLVDDKPLPLPSYSRAIVDSGTTLIVFSTATFNKFKQYLLTHYCNVPGLCPGQGSSDDEESWFQAAHCAQILAEDRHHLPTLTFRLEGFDLVMGPEDYLINYASKGSEFWCVGIMSLDSMSGGIDVILGNTVMKKYVTQYDRANGRVGFALSDTNCGLSAASTETPSDATTNAGNVNGLGAAGGSGEDADETCAVATSCTNCFNIKDASCKWDVNKKKCVGGSALPWMCKLEEIESNIGVWIGGSVAAVVLAIIVVAVVVKLVSRREASPLDDDMETEVQPLADDGNVRDPADTKDAFAIGGDEEDEESGRRT